MLLIHVSIFILYLASCNGIKCVAKTQVQLITSETSSSTIETSLKQLKTSASPICQVYMEFDSIAQKFTIEFNPFMKFPHLRSIENTYIHIVTSIVSVDQEKKMNQSSIKTTVQLVCSSNDGCDRQLVLDSINWLMKTNYRHLEFTIRPVSLVQDGKRNECTIGDEDHVQPCNNTACSWYYSMDTKQGEGKCESIDVHPLPTLELTTEITMFEKYMKQREEDIKPVRAIWKHSSAIKFWCELNNCNNHQITERITKAVSEQNDLWSLHKIDGTDRK